MTSLLHKVRRFFCRFGVCDDPRVIHVSKIVDLDGREKVWMGPEMTQGFGNPPKRVYEPFPPVKLVPWKSHLGETAEQYDARISHERMATQ